jgi:hypothetical protein
MQDDPCDAWQILTGREDGRDERKETPTRQSVIVKKLKACGPLCPMAYLRGR